MGFRQLCHARVEGSVSLFGRFLFGVGLKQLCGQAQAAVLIDTCNSHNPQKVNARDAVRAQLSNLATASYRLFPCSMVMQAV